MQGNSERGWSVPCDHEILDAVHGFLQSHSSYPGIMYKSDVNRRLHKTEY
jgi:hypothetical protein